MSSILEAPPVAVVGATGFVGRYVVPELTRAGYRVRAISRYGRRMPDWDATVDAVAGDVETGDGLREALDGILTVVHLTAIARPSRGHTLVNVNVRGVERTLAAAHANGVQRIVYLGALGAVDDPKLGFLYTKWLGEQLVRESGLKWVVLRPSLLFGRGDGFFNLIRKTLKYWSPGVVAIPGDGETRFQPLSVEDLAIAVRHCVADGDRAGSVYELGGPAYLTYREIVDAVMAATGKRRLKINLPIPIISALTAVTDVVLPVFPVSHDQIGSLGRPNWTDLDSFQRAFGVAPRPFDVSYMA